MTADFLIHLSAHGLHDFPIDALIYSYIHNLRILLVDGLDFLHRCSIIYRILLGSLRITTYVSVWYGDVVDCNTVWFPCPRVSQLEDDANLRAEKIVSEHCE